MDYLNRYQKFTGVIHNHTIYSDGSGTVPHLMECAGELGLDFVVVTDHFNMKAREEGFEGFHFNPRTSKQTALLVGYETEDSRQQNHYLILGTDKVIKDKLDPEIYVNQAQASGAVGIIAHPVEKDKPGRIAGPYAWNRWDLENFTGIEIWNQMSEWVGKLTNRNKFYYIFHPLKSIIAPEPEIMDYWDKQSMKRLIPAIGGVDAHGLKKRIMGCITLTIFHYKVEFKSLRNHFYLPRRENPVFEIWKQDWYEALKAGKSYISNYRLGDAAQFEFYAKCGDEFYLPGSVIENERCIDLHVFLPSSSEIRLIMNGKELRREKNKEMHYSTDEPGNYRIEAWKGKRCWIITNQIRFGCYPQ